jgi:hypothetical protein
MDPDDDQYSAIAALAKISVGVECAGIETVMFGLARERRQQNNLLHSDLLLVGRKLSYLASARNGSLSLSVANADRMDIPRRLFDSLPAAQWQAIARLVLALEHSGRSEIHERPLQVGEAPGDDCWVID